MRKQTELVVEGKRLQVSNLEKVLYPKAGFTKGEIIHYYIQIAPVLLPHLKNRPLTLKRYPNGVEQPFFYEKNCPVHRPGWVRTTSVRRRSSDDEILFCMANDLPTLVWAANLADLELHTSLARAPKVESPTMVVFDLDPGPPATVLQCAQVALWLRELLGELKLESFPKTSGSKGLQIYVPLNTPSSYDQTKPFAKAIAEQLENSHRELIVSKMAKQLRRGKVFVDWSQNDFHKTTVCVYSLRARESPTVSTPVTWAEVESAWKQQDASGLSFESRQVVERAKAEGDLFEPVLKLKQRLPRS
jgi:bifunctional non-homologous end joining protein LigD